MSLCRFVGAVSLDNAHRRSLALLLMLPARQKPILVWATGRDVHSDASQKRCAGSSGALREKGVVRMAAPGWQSERAHVDVGAPDAAELIGRDRDLALADDVLARARSGHGGLLLVSGDVGTGKSALCRAIANRAARHAVHRVHGRAYTDDSGTALAPVIDGLRNDRRAAAGLCWQAAARRRTLLAPDLAELAGDDAATTVATPAALFEGILDVFDEAGQGRSAGPGGLEDLHLADRWAHRPGP